MTAHNQETNNNTGTCTYLTDKKENQRPHIRRNARRWPRRRHRRRQRADEDQSKSKTKLEINTQIRSKRATCNAGNPSKPVHPNNITIFKTQASRYAGSLDPIGSPRTGIQTQASTLQKPGENHQSKVNKRSQLSHMYRYVDSLKPLTSIQFAKAVTGQRNNKKTNIFDIMF